MNLPTKRRPAVFTSTDGDDCGVATGASGSARNDCDFCDNDSDTMAPVRQGHENEIRRHKSDVGKHGGFGLKRITFWGSFCLNLNNCMGPAMVLLPLLNQQAGWLTCSVMMVVAYLLSTLAATMLCEAMQRIPGNNDFNMRYEFATLVRHYYGYYSYIIFQVLYTLSMQASNIAAMIISAQVVDRFIDKVGHASYALNFVTWKLAESHIVPSEGLIWCDVGEHCDPEHDQTWVISLGYIVCAVICIPFGYLNLDENMWFQWFSLVGLVLFTAEFIGQFIFNMVHPECSNDSYTLNKNVTCSGNVFEQTPLISPTIDAQSQVLGISTFAYAYVVTIPSWVNEKKPGVNVNRAVWYPATVGLFMKLAVGLMGAWAFRSLSIQENDIVETMLRGSQPPITQYSAYLWDITTMIPGIPVLAVMVRYNLLSGNVCGRFGSFFWGVLFPWIATAFCYEKKGALDNVCNWVAILFQGYINFVVPAMLYRRALIEYPNKGEYMGNVVAAVINEDGTEKLLRDESGQTLSEDPVNAVPPKIDIGPFSFKLNPFYVADTIIVVFALLSTFSIISNILDVFNIA
eukprot:m.135992 g.135992  ORF g.135992 m.135992 type:complete len:573 (-) comp11426_c6_seq1:40-1758(-)